MSLKKKSKKNIEFKKMAFLGVVIACMGFLIWSYILASVGAYQVNESLSEALVHTVLGSYVAYVVASLGEKNSRNKYGINENGNRVSKMQERGEKGDD